MPHLYEILDERHCILYLRNMLTTFRQSSKTKQRQTRCSVDSQLRHQEKPIPRSAPREHRVANNLPCSPSLFPKGEEKGYKSIFDRLLNSPRDQLSQIDIEWTEEHCAWMRLRPKITLFSLQHQSASDVKMLGCLCSTVRVRTAQ